MPIALWALAAGAFGIGTTEFVIMGLLPEVGADLGVSIPQAGLLVTGYALGVVVGAPPVAILTARLPRKTLLLGLMLIFTLGNLACALAPGYGALMAARVLTSLAHGAFFGVGSVVATSLVRPDKQASAIALMFTGLTLANVLGVPFGTWLGQAWGWRATFWAVTAVGIAAMAAIMYWVPASRGQHQADLAGELRALARPQVLLGFAMTVLGFGGVFTTFTYIAPILTGVSGIAAAAVSPILLLFGVGLVAGNTLGGRLADRRLMPTLVGSLAVLAAVLAAFAWTAHHSIAAVATVALLGAAAFATVPPLQMRAAAGRRRTQPGLGLQYRGLQPGQCRWRLAGRTDHRPRPRPGRHAAGGGGGDRRRPGPGAAELEPRSAQRRESARAGAGRAGL